MEDLLVFPIQRTLKVLVELSEQYVFCEFCEVGEGGEVRIRAGFQLDVFDVFGIVLLTHWERNFSNSFSDIAVKLVPRQQYSGPSPQKLNRLQHSDFEQIAVFPSFAM